MATDGTRAGSNLFQPLRHANPFWGEAVPAIIDFTNVTRSVWEDATDNVDLAVVESVTGVGAVALWRAYRRDAVDMAKRVPASMSVAAEHGGFDFAVSLLEVIAQVKAGRFDDAQTFILQNRLRLAPGQKIIWVDALGALKDGMADATQRRNLEKLLSAVLQC